MKQLSILYAKHTSPGRTIWLSFVFIALLSFNNLLGATKTASVSGNWNSTTTWGGSAIPLYNDDAIINTGVTVTMDVDASCKSVTTGTAEGTAAIDGDKTLSTGALTITQGNVTDVNVIFSIGRKTTLVCTSILTIIGGVNGTVELIISGTLKNSGTTNSLNAFTCNTGSTVEYNGRAQIVFPTTYSHLIISGSGTKTTSNNVYVNGILSMEGTATVSVAPTYGSAATLQYNTATARIAGAEWIKTFQATGGVIIKNTGIITMNDKKTLILNIPLTITSGATLATGTTATWNLIVGGSTILSGTLILANTAIKEFTGDVTINSGGAWIETVAATVCYAGNLHNDGSYYALTGIHMFKGTNKTISGPVNIEIPILTFLGNYINSSILSATKLTVESGITLTNNNTITCTGLFNGSHGLIIQGNNGTLNIGSSMGIPLNAEASGNTVNYIGNGTTQVVQPTTYHHLTVSGNVTKKIYNAVIANGVLTIDGALTVEPLGSLTNNGSMVINSSGTASGSFINNGNYSGTGTFIYNRWLDHTDMKITDPSNPGYSRWHIISAPVNVTSGFDVNAIKIHQDANDNNVYDFATYNEPTNDWNYVAAVPAGLVAGKGYLMSLLPASDGIIQFTGALNNGNVNPTVTTIGSDNGWNAQGNPYTSAMKVIGTGGFLNVNTANLDPDYAAIYVWNEDAAYSGTEQYYRVIGNSGYAPVGEGVFSEIMESNIQAGQGFMIHSNGTNSTVTFDKAMQVHQTDLTLKSADVSWPGITLLAESHGQTRGTIVAFNHHMANGLDVTYDAGLLASDQFQVYTHLADGSNTVDFAIQCLPDNQYNQLLVPVGVDLPEGGDLVFKASGIILPAGLYPIIEDKILNIKTLLANETDSYSVTLAKNTTGIGRFYLSFGTITSVNPTVELETKYTASFINNRITIYGAVKHGTKALLYDVSGRKVGEYTLENLNRNEIKISGLNQRVYLLKIEGKNYSQVLKLQSV